MANFMTYRIEAAEVNDPRSFAEYCQQKAGIPYPGYRQMPALRKTLATFFEQNPKFSYPMLCRVVDWVRARKRRVPHAHMVPSMFRYAWADGYLPELDPSEQVDDRVEAAIKAALVVETDPDWRRRLLGSRGLRARREVLEAWRATSSSISR